MNYWNSNINLAVGRGLKKSGVVASVYSNVPYLQATENQKFPFSSCSFYQYLWSILLSSLSKCGIHRSKPLWGYGFLESRPNCTRECQCWSCWLDLETRLNLVFKGMYISRLLVLGRSRSWSIPWEKRVTAI